MRLFYDFNGSDYSRGSFLQPTDAELAQRAAGSRARELFPLNVGRELQADRSISPAVAEATGGTALNGATSDYTEAQLTELMQTAILHPIDLSRAAQPVATK